MTTIMSTDRITHPRQRNQTRRVHVADGRPAVAKEYTYLCGDDVGDLFKIERRLRSAGVPMPEMLDWSADPPMTIHEYVEGDHSTQPSSVMIDSAVRAFARQLKALRRETVPRAPRRPVGLPARSRDAAIAARSSSLRNAIDGSWRRLSQLARTQPWVTTHGDWRADNLLFRGDEIVAVLDWEILIDLPAAEAVGYAAASLTHSWRTDLRVPLDAKVITAFLDCAERLGLINGSTSGHARLAAFHIAAVRLVEDQAVAIDTPSLVDITGELGAR